MNLEIPKQEKQ